MTTSFYTAVSVPGNGVWRTLLNGDVAVRANPALGGIFTVTARRLHGVFDTALNYCGSHAAKHFESELGGFFSLFISSIAIASRHQYQPTSFE